MALSCWNFFSSRGSVVVRSVAKVDSGTSVLSGPPALDPRSPVSGRGRPRRAGAGDVDVGELIRGQPIGALDLRDHLVAAALDAEPVHVVASKQRRQVLPRLAEIDALRAQLVAVEHDLGLRLIELDVGIGEDEHPAGKRLLNELPRELLKLLGLRRRCDDEIDREITAAGQRRRRERDDADPRDLRERPHRLHQQLLGGLLSFTPGFRDHAAETARWRDDLKDAGRFGE